MCFSPLAQVRLTAWQLVRETVLIQWRSSEVLGRRDLVKKGAVMHECRELTSEPIGLSTRPALHPKPCSQLSPSSRASRKKRTADFRGEILPHPSPAESWTVAAYLNVERAYMNIQRDSQRRISCRCGCISILLGSFSLTQPRFRFDHSKSLCLVYCSSDVEPCAVMHTLHS